MRKTVIVEKRSANGRTKRETITVDNKGGYSGTKATTLKKRDISGEPANVHAFFNKLQHA